MDCLSNLRGVIFVCAIVVSICWRECDRPFHIILECEASNHLEVELLKVSSNQGIYSHIKKIPGHADIVHLYLPIQLGASPAHCRGQSYS